MNFADLTLDRLQAMRADPRNAALAPVLDRRIAELSTRATPAPPPLRASIPHAPAPVPAVPRSSRPRRATGTPNQTEAAFAAEVLESRRVAGLSLRYLFERLAFRLPEVGNYRVDYVEVLADGALWCWEVKGAHVWEDARKTFKLAAREYPWIRWTMVQRKGRGRPWRVLYDRGAVRDPLPREIQGTALAAVAWPELGTPAEPELALPSPREARAIIQGANHTEPSAPSGARR